MNCFSVREKLFSYCEGELPQDEKEEIESHLSSCPACRTEKNRCEETLRAIRESEWGKGNDVALSVAKAIGQEKHRRKGKNGLRILLIAACVGLLAVTAIPALNRGSFERKTADLAQEGAALFDLQDGGLPFPADASAEASDGETDTDFTGETISADKSAASDPTCSTSALNYVTGESGTPENGADEFFPALEAARPGVTKNALAVFLISSSEENSGDGTLSASRIEFIDCESESDFRKAIEEKTDYFKNANVSFAIFDSGDSSADGWCIAIIQKS